MWWWEFNGEEPLQEDIAVYEKFLEFRADRERMDRDKAEQKARSQKGKLGNKQGGGTKYNIPDSI